MSYWLVAAAIVLAGTGVVHSVLGERYVIHRLLRGDVPQLFGSDWFTRRTIRFAWHLTTVTWIGIAVIQIVLSAHFGDRALSEQATLVSGSDPAVGVGWAVAAALVTSAVLTAAASKGRHLAWIAFLASGALTIVGIR